VAKNPQESPVGSNSGGFDESNGVWYLRGVGPMKTPTADTGVTIGPSATYSGLRSALCPLAIRLSAEAAADFCLGGTPYYSMANDLVPLTRTAYLRACARFSGKRSSSTSDRLRADAISPPLLAITFSTRPRP